MKFLQQTFRNSAKPVSHDTFYLIGKSIGELMPDGTEIIAASEPSDEHEYARSYRSCGSPVFALTSSKVRGSVLDGVFNEQGVKFVHGLRVAEIGGFVTGGEDCG